VYRGPEYECLVHPGIGGIFEVETLEPRLIATHEFQAFDRHGVSRRRELFLKPHSDRVGVTGLGVNDDTDLHASILRLFW
jgi:hypothetical protein